MREPGAAGVDRLLLGHEGLGPFDDVAHAVDEALLLRGQDELIVHLEDEKKTCLVSLM